MRSSKHSFSTLTVGIFLAMSLSLIGCGHKDAEQAKQQGQGQQAPTPEVGVMIAQAQAVENMVELSGRLAAYQVSEVRPQASGVILKRLFSEGSYVREGQALYELDNRTNQALVQSAEASLARQKANLNSLQVKANRYKQLVSSNAVSKQEFDDIMSQVQLAEADVKAAQANVESAKINFQFSTIRAPISGQTGQSSVTAGALVTANQAQSLVTIQQLDPIYVNINQSSAELLRLRQQLSQGQLSASNDTKVKLRLEDGSDYPIEGKLAFSNASVDPTTGTVTLRAVFANPNHLLLPGMFANARIVQGVVPQAYLVPQAALTRTPTGQATVLLVNAAGKVESRTVQTSGVNAGNWVVTDGLKEGDKVIVEGVAKVKPDMPVKTRVLKQQQPQTQPADSSDEGDSAHTDQPTV